MSAPKEGKPKVTVGRVYAISTLLAVIIAVPAVAVTLVMHYVIKAEIFMTLTAGLNITSYDLKFELEDGSRAESAGVTVPLPVIGLRMGYSITPKWNVRYVSEAFFVEFDDAFRGAIINFELNTEYRLFKHFALGAGIARIGINAEVDDDDWRGQVTDSYRGFNIFGTFYF